MHTSREPYRAYQTLDEQAKKLNRERITYACKIAFKEFKFKLKQDIDNIESIKFDNESKFKFIHIYYKDKDISGKDRETLRYRKDPKNQYLFFENEKGIDSGQISYYPESDTLTALYKGILNSMSLKLSQDVQNIEKIEYSLQDNKKLIIRYTDSQKEELPLEKITENNLTTEEITENNLTTTVSSLFTYCKSFFTTKSPSLPTKSPSLPTKSPSLPTVSPSLPTKSPSLPTKSPSLPTLSLYLPTVSPSFPTVSPSLNGNYLSNITTTTESTLPISVVITGSFAAGLVAAGFVATASSLFKHLFLKKGSYYVKDSLNNELEENYKVKDSPNNELEEIIIENAQNSSEERLLQSTNTR